MPQKSSDLEARIIELEMENARLRDEARQFQESHFHSILNKIPVMIGYWDKNLLNRFANQAYHIWFGVEPSWIHGKHIRELIGEEIFQQYFPCIEGVLRGEEMEFEREFTMPDGMQKTHLLVKLLPDIYDGEVQGFYSHVTDITNVKEVEEFSRLLGFALNQVGEAFFMTDESGHFNYVNNEACRFLGYDMSELTGMSVSDIDPDWPAERWPEHWNKIKSEGTLTFEGRLKARDSRIFPVEINSSYFEFSDKPFTLALVRDITERKLAKSTLQLHSEILMHVQEGVQITRISDESIIYTTPVFNRMFGYSENELIGQKVSKLNAATEKSPEEISDEINRQLELSGFWQGEINNLKKDGSTFWCWVNISTFDHHEYGMVWVAVHEDISQRKQAELENRQARESMYRDVLVQEVHHRIKNNLQGIIGVLDQHARTHPGLAEPINQAIGQVRSVAIIHGLQGRTGISRVQLCELTSAITEGISSLWNKSILVDIPSTWVPCRIEESEAVPVALIINELITNAVNHGGPNGEVSIKLRREPGRSAVKLIICNAGIIPAGFGLQDLKQLGTGLQLVASLLPNSGASIYWENQLGKVITTFELDIPTISINPELSRP